LSAATIRNVMADLSDSGFLDQPHTSAGRVPTPEAYRYYVEQISGRAQISAAEQDKIAGSFTGVGDVQEFLERTSHVLSLISSGGSPSSVPNMTGLWARWRSCTKAERWRASSRRSRCMWRASRT